MEMTGRMFGERIYDLVYLMIRVNKLTFRVVIWSGFLSSCRTGKVLIIK